MHVPRSVQSVQTMAIALIWYVHVPRSVLVCLVRARTIELYKPCLHVVRAWYVRLKAYNWLARTARTPISYDGPLIVWTKN